MVDFFIHRPVFSTVCALLIILAGAVCIPTLPIAQFPDLAPPQVAVTAVYTGASSQTVESAVTTPLEQQINGAEGMKYITSSSTNDGVSTVTATFDITRDPDLAAVDIENRVNTASGRLPPRSSKWELPSPRPRRISFLAAQYSRRTAVTPRFLSVTIWMFMCATTSSACRAWPTSFFLASANTRCGCGLIRCAWRAALLPRMTW